jgi:hypothetical protein
LKEQLEQKNQKLQAVEEELRGMKGTRALSEEAQRQQIESLRQQLAEANSEREEQVQKVARIQAFLRG